MDMCRVWARDREGRGVGRAGWASCDERGRIWLRAGAENFGQAREWAWVFSVLALETALLDWAEGMRLSPEGALALGLEARRLAKLANAGSPPDEFAYDAQAYPNRSCRELEKWLLEGHGKGLPQPPSLAGPGFAEFSVSGEIAGAWNRRKDFKAALAEGIAKGAQKAVKQASGSAGGELSVAAQAKRWLGDAYPLLGAAVALFELVEDEQVCARQGVAVAAVCPSLGEIWINPRARLDLEECKFVIAHEALHAALDHLGRRRGRDPWLWNCAADFVVNGWLEEMGVGRAPGIGLLRDKAFDGKSVEDVYDWLAKEGRRARKLACLSGGCGVGDMLEGPGGAVNGRQAAYKRALMGGAGLHESLGRGSLPGGLAEEIRALASPPAPWDVELALWMSARFVPRERQRSYGRPSRRQAASPGVPRPGKVAREEERPARVLGAVVDTSASMDRALLGKALGALASTCESLDVDYVRLVWCDVDAFDAGWKESSELWGKCKAHGRGGTALQAGFDLLARLAQQGEVPRGMPVLAITDGWCEEKLDARGFDSAALVAPGGPKPAGVGAYFWLM